MCFTHQSVSDLDIALKDKANDAVHLEALEKGMNKAFELSIISFLFF